MPVRRLLRRLVSDKSGATAIEYGLIVGIVGVGLIASANGLASGVISLWTTFTAVLATANTSTSA